MPSQLRRHDEPGHTHFWTISCYRRLQFFHDDGMKQVVHKNPITRGLVAGAGDWRWSSYRFYEHADASVLAMDWNGGWPIEWS